MVVSAISGSLLYTRILGVVCPSVAITLHP